MKTQSIEALKGMADDLTRRVEAECGALRGEMTASLREGGDGDATAVVAEGRTYTYMNPSHITNPFYTFIHLHYHIYTRCTPVVHPLYTCTRVYTPHIHPNTPLLHPIYAFKQHI